MVEILFSQTVDPATLVTTLEMQGHLLDLYTRFMNKRKFFLKRSKEAESCGVGYDLKHNLEDTFKRIIDNYIPTNIPIRGVHYDPPESGRQDRVRVCYEDIELSKGYFEPELTFTFPNSEPEPKLNVKAFLETKGRENGMEIIEDCLLLLFSHTPSDLFFPYHEPLPKSFDLIAVRKVNKDAAIGRFEKGLLVAPVTAIENVSDKSKDVDSEIKSYRKGFDATVRELLDKSKTATHEEGLRNNYIAELLKVMGKNPSAVRVPKLKD
jgi:hypothetical protein